MARLPRFCPEGVPQHLIQLSLPLLLACRY